MSLTVEQACLHSLNGASFRGSPREVHELGTVTRRDPAPIGFIAGSGSLGKGDVIMMLIALGGKHAVGKNAFALIDDEDFDLVDRHGPWHAVKCKSLTNGEECVYARSKPGGYMHRLIMRAGPDEQVDHKDHWRVNNVKGNLRICTTSQNAFNRRKIVVKTSDYMGVCWAEAEGSWRAQIQLGGGTRATRKNHVISNHPDQVNAAYARDRFVRENPEKCSFATLNFPEKTNYSDVVECPKRISSCGLYGVSYKTDRGVYRVRLTDPKTGKSVYGGAYRDRDEAGRIADRLMNKLGIEGHLNFPEGGGK